MSDQPSIVFTDVNERQGTFHRRIFLTGGVVAFGFFAMAGRLAHLQIIQHSKLKALSELNEYNHAILPPPRGQILDRNGKVIAGNRPSFRVLVMRSQVKDIDETLDKISYVLPQVATTRKRILRDINQVDRYVPVAIASDLSWDDFSRVNLYAPQIPGAVPDMNEVRVYHYGGAFSHVVGYVSKPSQRDIDAETPEGQEPDKLLLQPGFRIGKQGVEKAFDKALRGTPGIKKIKVTSTGSVVSENNEGDVPPVPGKVIVLTLDAEVLARALDVFGADSGGCVMMDIHSGDIMCMLSAPSFDGNMFVSGISGPAYGLLRDYERIPLLDKAIGSTFPPGSTFKTMVALAALENGYDPKTTHTCNGVFPFGNHVFKCDGHHGTLDLHHAIVTSCDVYFYQTALAVGVDKIAETARKFGLGQTFDIGIEGQRRGIVPDTAWKKAFFKNDPKNQVWFPGETPSVGIGQGATNVNPLQSCVMVSRLANGRKAILPRLIKSIGGVEQPSGAAVPDLPFNNDHIAFVRAAMADVVVSGTAAGQADLGLGSIKMAGKTGTAQSHEYGGGRGAHGARGDWAGRDHGWFVAFAPYDDPIYAMSVVVQHGGFGSTSAAPKAREIMKLALEKNPIIQKRLAAPPPAPLNTPPSQV